MFIQPAGSHLRRFILWEMTVRKVEVRKVEVRKVKVQL